MSMEGMEGLKELKSVLRSLVVSSPTEVDLRTLMRDYRNMMGEAFPLSKFGYRDVLTFIKERCSDCFVIQDSSNNPVLTLIVPDTVKHIDKFVQKQKATPNTRMKGKRTSVQQKAIKRTDGFIPNFPTFTSTKKEYCAKTDYIIQDDREVHSTQKTNSYSNNTSNEQTVQNGSCIEDHNEINHINDINEKDSKDNDVGAKLRSSRDENGEVNGTVCSSTALQNFMKKRMLILSRSQELDIDKDSSRGDTDSGRLTASTGSSSKKAQLEDLKAEIREVIAEVPEGVWCTELMKLYREKYGRELNFSRFGFTSVLSLAYAVPGVTCCAAEHTGELLLLAAGAPAPATPTPPRAPASRPVTIPAVAAAAVVGVGVDPDDALPGIDFDEDVFPRDCMHIIESVPAQELAPLATGAMLEVVLGEVYSPSHFWFLRLGPNHYGAMEDLMDEMNQYYKGEGKDRALATGAVRVGHYCSCCYQDDWHRAVIVKIVDSDTVKVRHIDYATVETVPARALKPLLRRWGRLPAQALRGRLAAVRPPAGGRRWPWAAAAHFLTLVQEKKLIANVVAKDAQEGILEVLLIDTSTEDDVCISAEMCRAGHADPRPDSALGTSECYLFPRFDALESGAAPNYAEIYCYLRDGISLDFVEDYRRHVPPSLPPAPPPPRAPAAPPARATPPLCLVPPRRATLADTVPPGARPALPARSQSPFQSAAPESDSWRPCIAVASRVPLLRPSTEPDLELASETKPASEPESHFAPPRPSTSPPPRPARPPDHYRSLPSEAYCGFPVFSNPHPHQFPQQIAHTHLHPHPNSHPQPHPYPNSHPQLHSHSNSHPQTHPHSHPHPPPHPHPHRNPNQHPSYPVSYPNPYAPPFYPQMHPHRFSPPSQQHFVGLSTFHPFPAPAAPPAPAPAPARNPAPAPAPAPGGGVSVPKSECEIFALLSRVDPAAAHRYMVDALSRALAATTVTTVTAAMTAPAPAPAPMSTSAPTQAPATSPPVAAVTKTESDAAAGQALAPAVRQFLSDAASGPLRPPPGFERVATRPARPQPDRMPDV